MPAGVRNGALAVFFVTGLVHFPPIDNFLDNDDAWNYVLEADRFLSGEGSAWVEGGGYFAHQNLQRLVPSLTWIARYGLFEFWMPGWHLPSILLHAFNAFLLILLLSRLRQSPAVSVFTGLLFGLSPMHPHVVSWIGGSYDIFAGSFLLGTLIFFIDRRRIPTLLCCAGALMSKESGVMIAPVLALYVLAFERDAGFRAAVKRLIPVAIVTAMILGLRLLQIRLGGSIDQAGLPARTVGFSLDALLLTGPSAIGVALVAPLRGLTVLTDSQMAAAVAGVLVLAFAVRRSCWREPTLWFAGLSGYLFLIPVLVLREEGHAYDLDEILLNARYLYLPLLFSMVLIPLALFGKQEGTPPLLLRSLAIVAGLGTLVSTGQAVWVLTQVDPATPVILEKLESEQLPTGGRTWILANVYDNGPFRLVLSRWLAQELNSEFHWVQRGSWRDIRRKRGIPYALDFKDYYVEVAPEPFDPRALDPALDRVYALSHGGPLGGHRLVRVTLPTAEPELERTERVQTRWDTRPTDLEAGAKMAAGGAIDFVVHSYNDRPGGYRHLPLVQSAPLSLDIRVVSGIRLEYSGELKAAADTGSRFSFGYAELHWTAKSVRQADSFVQIPLQLDRQRHTIDIPLWFDPGWIASGAISALGISPFDVPARVRVHAVTVLYNRAEQGR